MIAPPKINDVRKSLPRRLPKVLKFINILRL